MTGTPFDQDEPYVAPPGPPEAAVPASAPQPQPPIDDLARPPELRPRPLSDDHPSATDARERPGCGRRAATAAAVIVLLLVVLGIGGWQWWKSQIDPGGATGPAVVVEIPKGSSTAGIGKVLQKAGVIPNATAFRYWVSWHGRGPFQAGRYRLLTHSSVESTVAVLAKGPLPPPIVKVTVPEGFRLAQVVDRIHSRVPRFATAQVNHALASGRITSTLLPPGSTNWEGLLFPATYQVGEKTTLDALLQQMASAMDQRAATADFAAASATLHLTPYELVTVASLIQAEAGNPDEAPKIARVIYNRIRNHLALGIDATSVYLAKVQGGPVDLDSPSPYNTRRHVGLPPTPIGSPGDDAIQAALHPAAGDWIYYVRDINNDALGRPQHVFTASAAEFERAKKACHDAGLGCG